MSWHIVCLFGDDNYSPELRGGDQSLVLPFQEYHHYFTYVSSLIETFDTYGLTPTAEAMEILNAAIGAYIADIRVPRGETTDGWTRDMVLHFAVRDPQQWEPVVPVFQELLSFLTGDYWAVVLRQLPKSQRLNSTKPVQKKPQSKIVSLFSGGLDSFIGAIDQVERYGNTVLVGHHGRGGGATSVSQNDAIQALRKCYDDNKAPFLRFWIVPPKNVSDRTETTTRARSIIFFGLGLAVASALGEAKLIVPENGFISLNIPLTPSRLGSFSTRTTHPYLIDLLRKLIVGLGISIEIELPYRFMTKGEMLQGCQNRPLIETVLSSTMSCSHPSANRFTTAKDPNIHCGYCVPCLVRRAAIQAGGFPDPTSYAFEDLAAPLSTNRASDLKAFRIAIDRYKSHPPLLKDVLVSGTLPGTDDELRSYLGVYQRGLTEVATFLRRYTDTQ
ncbi:MAG: hypothetical protein HS103_07940 [Anaerolineales bacterium]|nr:hypothetical protein [Anaerolineales bacterium]